MNQLFQTSRKHSNTIEITTDQRALPLSKSPVCFSALVEFSKLNAVFRAENIPDDLTPPAPSVTLLIFYHVYVMQLTLARWTVTVGHGSRTHRCQLAAWLMRSRQIKCLFLGIQISPKLPFMSAAVCFASNTVCGPSWRVIERIIYPAYEAQRLPHSVRASLLWRNGRSWTEHCLSWSN